MSIAIAGIADAIPILLFQNDLNFLKINNPKIPVTSGDPAG
jgi:hypothetical protein